MSTTSDTFKNLLTFPLSIIFDVGNFDGSAFGLWLRKKRESERLSVSELARKSGVSKQYISALEQANPHILTNKQVQPGLDKVEQIAVALGADLNEARLIAGYVPRNGHHSKPQNAAEFAERLRDMGFEIQTDFDFEKLGPDDLQDVIDQIETNLILKARRKKKIVGEI